MKANMPPRLSDPGHGNAAPPVFVSACKLLHKTPNALLHFRKSATAMGNCVLLVGGELRERLRVAVGNEKRIVSESAGSRSLAGYRSVAAARQDVFSAVGIDKRHAAREVRAPVGHAFEIPEKQGIVRGGVGRFAGVARAAHSRFAAERGDL